MAGAKQYVESKNADIGGNASRNEDASEKRPNLDDIRVSTSRANAKPTSNSRQTRSNGQPTKQPSKQQADARSQLDAQNRQINGEGHFYDTDVSGIDATSNTTSTKQSNVRASRAPQRPSSGEEGSLSESEEGESDEELPEQHDVPEISGHQLNPKQQRLAAIVENCLSKDYGGTFPPTIKGDSYPDTTSGRLSVVEPVEEDNLAGDQTNTVSQAKLPQRGSGMRAPVNVSSTQYQQQNRQPVGLDQRRQMSGQNHSSSRPPADTGVVTQNAPADFQFSRSEKPKLAMQPPSRQHDQSVTASSNNTAQRSTIPSADNTTHNMSGGHGRDTLVAKAAAQLQQVKQSSERPAKPHVQVPMQRPTIEAAPEDYGHFPDDDVVQQGLDSSELLPSEQELREVQLDYQVDDLYQMNLEDLNHQSFDTDPNVKPFKLPNGQQDEGLDVKLDVISKFHRQDQAKFFASLPIAEWEQAGDWFLDQFGGVLKKLKESRQERRRAAKVFEDEIAARHSAVDKKRKQTESELSLMKESGGKVLQGTPKKMRTR